MTHLLEKRSICAQEFWSLMAFSTVVAHVVSLEMENYVKIIGWKAVKRRLDLIITHGCAVTGSIEK